MTQQDEFLQRILSAFKLEADELVENITTCLLQLEKEEDNLLKREYLENIYRYAHTMKGASRAVDILEIESICQEMESVFSLLKSGDYSLNMGMLDIIHQSVETIRSILAVRIEKKEGINFDVNGIVIKLQQLLISLKKGEKIEREESFSEKPSSVPEFKRERVPISKASPKPEQVAVSKDEKTEKENETIRIATKKLGQILLQVEDLLSIKLSSAQVQLQLHRLIRNFELWEKKIQDIIPEVRYIEKRLEERQKSGELAEYDIAVKNAIRYLHRGNTLSRKTGQQLTKLSRFWDHESYAGNIRIDNLLLDVKKVVTVPFSELLQLFPKIVRDYCYDSKKSVKLLITGDTIEIDRRILERLKIPLIHLLRNCLDHGIEKPQVRQRKHKPETGLIRINLEHSENKRIRFTIEDDGAGVDLNKLRLTVQKNPQYNSLDLENKDKLLPFIFQSGISTSDMITEISGRGLGLAIIKKSIEELEGTIDVETEKDNGTRFIIDLPISLVTFRGIIIESAGREFVVPTTKIDHILNIKAEEVQSLENKRIIFHDREFVPLADLSAVLDISQKENHSGNILAILINDGTRQVALTIDNVFDEQEILAKNFNKHLKRIRNIAGATILGSGKVVPILNPSDLINSVFNDMSLVQRHDHIEERKRRVLVVEDSITSRMLMKSILENGGYDVETAFDGMDGFMKVIEGNFDLVISDVDMPRMSGFDMAAKIRADKNKGKIPIIMVTSLNKPEDLKKGEDVGANGYIVKSNFAQTDLENIIGKILYDKDLNR